MSKPPIQPRLISRKAAAAFLGISERLLWTISHEGRIPVVRIGRKLLYDRADLVDFIELAKRGRRK
jgi:excisionase family DNA binding protein